MTNIEIGTQVSYQTWSMEARAITTQTGTVTKIYKGSDPLVVITADRPELQQHAYTTRFPFKVRRSTLTVI